eukprot:15485198-Alexandrium_andersonii.AAC.1
MLQERFAHCEPTEQLKVWAGAARLMAEILQEARSCRSSAIPRESRAVKPGAKKVLVWTRQNCILLKAEDLLVIAQDAVIQEWLDSSALIR